MEQANKVDCDTLWEIFTFIRTKWQNTDGVDVKQFQMIINDRINLIPAYGDYYQESIAEYQRLIDQYGDKNRALDALFTENELPDPKLPNIANYVLAEFMRMQTAFGGFKKYGYENFSGWMGGGSYSQSPPPYRVYKGDEQ